MDVDRLLPDDPVLPQVGYDGRFLISTHAVDHAHADAAHLALRDARVQLWRDLWQKTTDVDRLVEERTAELVATVRRQRRQIQRMKRERRPGR